MFFLYLFLWFLDVHQRREMTKMFKRGLQIFAALAGTATCDYIARDITYGNVEAVYHGDVEAVFHGAPPIE